MTQQFAVPDDSPPHNPHYSDAFVVFSVTVLSCAIGAWLLLQLGLALWVGSVAALGVYAALLSFHLLVRSSLVPAAAAPVAAKRTTRAPSLSEPQAPQLETREAFGTNRPPSLAAEAARWAEAAITAKPLRPADELPLPRLGDPFNFRPSREPALSPPLQSSPARSSAGEAAQSPSLLDASQPEISVDFVEELIKKLADALNAATQRTARPAARA